MINLGHDSIGRGTSVGSYLTGVTYNTIGQLTGETSPTLAERRNTLAHGDPFEGLPTSGLLELLRDLINFAYRDYIAEAAMLGVRDASSGQG